MVIYRCPLCYKSFNRKSSYDYHVYKRTVPCNNNNKLPDNLINSSKKISLQCPQCDKVYSRRDNLKRHMDKFCKRETERQNIGKNICKYCKKQFKRSDYLYTHLKNNRCIVKKEMDRTKDDVHKQLVIQIKKQSDEIKRLKKLLLLKNGESNNRSPNIKTQFILTNGISDCNIDNIMKGSHFVCHKCDHKIEC